MRRPAELEEVDGLVIPGGESTTIWKLAEIFELAEPLRKRIAGGMPAFGSCAGMIMLAGRLTDAASGQETLGAHRHDGAAQRVRPPGRLLRARPGHRAAWPARPTARCSSGRRGCRAAGPEVEILATEPATGRIVAVRQGPVLATSFHPELTGDRRIHELFVNMVRERSMSGHSKWATTKHKKAVVDARRGKLFAKLIKNVEVAARSGGPDPAGNPTLYDAVQKAKRNSVPNDNIDRAVRRGAGLEAGGAAYEAITYEGYAPGGVAVLVECLTDNRNRAAAEVRTALTRNGGSMADPGSVSYLFNRKGVVIVPKADGRSPRTTC